MTDRSIDVTTLNQNSGNINLHQGDADMNTPIKDNPDVQDEDHSDSDGSESASQATEITENTETDASDEEGDEVGRANEVLAYTDISGWPKRDLHSKTRSAAQRPRSPSCPRWTSGARRYDPSSLR